MEFSTDSEFGKYGKVQLRQLRLQDLTALYDIVGDTRVTGNASFATRTDKAGTEKMLADILASYRKRPRQEYFLAATIAPDEVIGLVRLAWDDVDRVWQAGLAIAYSQQERGYGVSAAAAMLNYAFSELKLDLITAWVDPKNRQSIELLERLGFCNEEHTYNYVLKEGQAPEKRLIYILHAKQEDGSAWQAPKLAKGEERGKLKDRRKALIRTQVEQYLGIAPSPKGHTSGSAGKPSTVMDFFRRAVNPGAGNLKGIR